MNHGGSFRRARRDRWDADSDCSGRIAELENKIGAGLIEEVIQVAEGELKLVDTMIESKV